MLNRMKSLLVRLNKDDGGAEGLEKLLIIAAIVLPLLGVLIWFRDDIGRWVSGIWEDTRQPAFDPITTPSPTQGP